MKTATGTERLVVNLKQVSSISQILPRQPLISSDRANWHHLKFGYYRQPACETPEHSSSHHVISICLGHPTVKERTIDGCYQCQCFVYGDISITPANVSRKIRLEKEAEFIHIYLEPEFLTQTACELFDNDRIEITPQFKIKDLLIQGIGLALKAELELGCSSNRLYTESMATTLAVHLLRHYSLRQPPIQQFAGGLPKYKLQQILDYIDEHLAEDLSLEVMAALVDMSLHYFCRLFKQSTGMSPHKYLTQQRIERAKQLLKLQNAAIADIAIQCGFANQGHFTKSFRQLTGMTPKVYRNVV